MSDDKPARGVADRTVDEVVQRTRDMLRKSRELLQSSRDLLSRVNPGDAPKEPEPPEAGGAPRPPE